MKNIEKFALGTTILLLSSNAAAVNFNGYATLTTDYVFRGVTYSDGNPAAQLGADVSFDNGLFVGTWVSTMNIESSSGFQRDFEINYYIGFGGQLSKTWSASVTAIAYTYPGGGAPIDYDYEEIALMLNYDDIVWLEYAYAPDLYGTDRDTQNVEVYAEWPLPWALTVGAGVGWYDLSEITNTDYSYWQAGISRHVGIVDFDLRFHDTSRSVPFFSSDDRAAARTVLSVRFRF